MNYRIIEDENKLIDFINWLPDLKKNEQFYLCLFARSKYDISGVLKSDKSQLGRTMATKDRLLDKIKKFEVPLGSYKIKGTDAPQESLALYIHTTPRDMKKASIKTVKMILDNIEKDKHQNPKSIALNALQTSKSKTFRVDFDFDTTDEKYGAELKNFVTRVTGNKSCFDIVKTRGGYHVLVNPSITTNKMWYQNLSQNPMVDQSGDLMLPVPGCTQGGFVPKFI